MACAVCSADDVEVVVNETFAGKWQSACSHSACLPCVRRWVNRSLPNCRAFRQVRVQCFQPGCRKFLPQKLVLQASVAARELAEAGDQDGAVALPEVELCVGCQEPCRPLRIKACGHGACENCWERWAKAQLPRLGRAAGVLRVGCLHGPDYHEGVPTELWRQILVPSQAVRACIAAADLADAELKRLELSGCTVTRHDKLPTEAGPVCSICREHRIALLANDCDCCHAVCEVCWVRWAEEQIERCYFERAAAVRCIGEGCTKMAARALWDHACTLSKPLCDAEQLFKRRRRLQNNALFPAALQVNCPQPGCVGLGYLGYDTVMCFICEHQWVPDEAEAGDAPADDADIERIMGVKVKRCPKCSNFIEKNGGCDHMTCRHRGCGHEFWWTTLQPYRVG